ncbi:hypothetical protein [Beggiatoa alba]|uniref:hypothetical protein n=1 Tax=Beggiatoa alba TaxID=1022 RepID=UPI00030E445A|nr:hypothetical protein [Beggiatoa alba]
MHRQHAHRLINASAVVRNLSSVGDMPKNEAQVRPLVGLPPEKQREVWETVCNSDEPVTAERVKAVIKTNDSFLICLNKQDDIDEVFSNWGMRCIEIKLRIKTALINNSQHPKNLDKKTWDKILSVFEDIELIDKKLGEIEGKLEGFK